jgi:ketosteroid isomerase-like protein
MRSAENERLIVAMWDDYEREGLPGILRRAADDAQWRPHSSGGRVFRSTAEYREQIEQAQASGIRVESTRLGLWSDGDVVVVRGRIRTRRGGVLDDTRMYWLHRVRDGQVVWTSSSPDLAGLLEEAGLDRRLASEAYISLQRTTA